MILDNCPKFKVPDNPEDPFYDLMYGLQELVDKWPQYREARRKYAGEIDEFSNNLTIERILRKTSELYKFNLAAVPVKVMRNRLKLGGIRVDDGAQPEFDTIWTANDMEVWFPKIVLTALKYGDAYVRAWTTPEEDAGDEDDDLQKAGVLFNLQHPMTTCLIYDEETQRRALYAVKYYQYGDRWRADLEYRDRIFHFVTRAKKNRGLKPVDWQPFKPPYQVVDADGKIQTEYAPEVEENTFGEISIKHCRTDLPYGIPIHIDAYGPQNAISKLLVTQISVVDRQGWPARVALMDPAAVLDENNDTPNWDDDGNAPGAADGRATVDSQIRGEPGAVETLAGIKAIDQWAAAEPKTFTDPIELYMSLMSTLTETPFYSFKPGGEQPSGKAREIADAPLEANKERLQALISGFLRDLVKFAMRVAGTATKSVEVVWLPTNLATDTDDWGVIGAMREEGIPFEVRMARAGFAPETLAKWIAEKQDMSTQERIQLASQIAEMVKNLNVAVAGNIVSEDDANAILKDIMGELGFSISKAPEPDPVPVVMGGNADGTASGATGQAAVPPVRKPKAPQDKQPMVRKVP